MLFWSHNRKQHRSVCVFIVCHFLSSLSWRQKWRVSWFNDFIGRFPQETKPRPQKLANIIDRLTAALCNQEPTGGSSNTTECGDQARPSAQTDNQCYTRSTSAYLPIHFTSKWYDAWFALEHWQASCLFNLARKLKKLKMFKGKWNERNWNEITAMLNILKDPETDGYEIRKTK